MQAMLGGYIAFAVGQRLRSVQGKSPLREQLFTQRSKANRRALKARGEAPSGCIRHSVTAHPTNSNPNSLSRRLISDHPSGPFDGVQSNQQVNTLED
jgi:hypothetical protein